MKTIVLSFLVVVISSHGVRAQQSINAEAGELIRNGKYDEAEKRLTAYQQTLSQATPFEERAALNTSLGALYLNKGRNDLALEYLQLALYQWDQSGKAQTLEAAESQSMLGNLFRATGKYSQAEEQLSIALMIRRKNLSPTDELIAASLNDLGLVYTFSDIDKALSHYEQALEIYEQVHGTSHAKIAIAQTNIGYLYTQQEFFGDAVNNFKSALIIWDKIYQTPHPAKAFVLFNLGMTHEKMNDLKSARSYYEQSLELYTKVYSGKHPDLARVHNAIGNLEKAENKFDLALHHYQLAMGANHPLFYSKNVLENPSVKEFYDGNVLLYSLMYKAQGLEQRYFKKTLRFKDLLLALNTLESCDSLISILRNQITNESDKITLGAIANEVYADGVRISIEASQAALKKDGFLNKAFFFSEKSKAAVLLGAITDANAKNFSGIPAQLLEEEKQIKSAMALCSQKLALKPSADEEQYLRQTFYELGRTYENFGKRLEKEYPSYFNLKFNSSSPTLRQLQDKLAANTMAISFFIDEKNNRLYTFMVSRNRFVVGDASLPEKFDRYITGLKNSLYFSEIGTYKKSATELSSVLVPKKIPPHITDLVIIPSSRLSTIPFEALFTDKVSDADSYKSLPYLARKYAVRYEFSGGLIAQKNLRAVAVSPSILLCAPVTFAPSLVPDLPGTEIEVNDIAGLFEARNFGTRKLVSTHALKRNLQGEDLKQYAYLHFATHGVVDETQPDLSRIFLRHDDGVDDGFLYAGEIYNMELNADLVTLSACETGLGKISKGEGVIGLSRALVYAGARSCMVSFWKVSDQSTALLMRNYYAALLDSPTHNLSATLRDAKLAMINHDRYSAPFYWAPFILIGF